MREFVFARCRPTDALRAQWKAALIRIRLAVPLKRAEKRKNLWMCSAGKAKKPPLKALFRKNGRGKGRQKRKRGAGAERAPAF
ncbi:MAG TPA: hypothetical protein H9813_11825 [Candidatus Fournierella merdipullorum]|uniref:Uncharacterized protein n=1 Tax=Candidatus Allofournierella merdipullorum TaxID=2838595 RepID=A0A9D2E647_9FIRM|nr:hypothetical protein [Candidatus Fournierella merdipullorum]